MNEEDVKNLIVQALQNYSRSSLRVPRHDHDKVNSPAISSAGNNLSSGTVKSVSVTTANGFSGTVTNATTTPGITISITTSGVLIGTGGGIAGTPLPSDPTQFLNGNGSFSTPSFSSSPYTVSADETNGGAFTTQINFITTQNVASYNWTLVSPGANFNYIPLGSNGFRLVNAGITGGIANARVPILAPSASNPTSGFSADTPNTVRIRFYGRIRSTTTNSSNRAAIGFSDLTGASDFYSETATDGRDVKFVFTNPSTGSPTTYAVCSNATAVTANNINIDATVYHIYEIVLIPQGNAKFYVDGVLVSTITTHLYASGSQILNLEMGSFVSVNTSDIELQLQSPTFSIIL